MYNIYEKNKSSYLCISVRTSTEIKNIDKSNPFAYPLKIVDDENVGISVLKQIIKWITSERLTKTIHTSNLITWYSIYPE